MRCSLLVPFSKKVPWLPCFVGGMINCGGKIDKLPDHTENHFTIIIIAIAIEIIFPFLG